MVPSQLGPMHACSSLPVHVRACRAEYKLAIFELAPGWAQLWAHLPSCSPQAAIPSNLTTPLRVSDLAGALLSAHNSISAELRMNPEPQVPPALPDARLSRPCRCWLLQQAAQLQLGTQLHRQLLVPGQHNSRQQLGCGELCKLRCMARDHDINPLGHPA